LIPTIATRLASKTAQSIVDKELKRGGTLLDIARRLRLLEAIEPTVFVRGTHWIHIPMTLELLRKEDTMRESQVGRSKTGFVVRTETNVESALGKDYLTRFPDDSLQQFHTNLIRRKGIGLLKTHLDLTSEAYRAGGDQKFAYVFTDALERQGHPKNEKRRGFHNEALRNLRQNLMVLGMLRVAVYQGRSTSGKQIVGRTPYWFTWLEHSEEENIEDLLGKHGSDYSTAAIMLPGAWWSFAQMNKYRMEVPQSILELPVDDHKNKTNFFVLLLASFLAIHVRRNQEQHAGKKIPISVGKLLEESGIITQADFMSLDPKLAVRERDYLQRIKGDGALLLLARHRANNVDIRDEDEFFATGRGWKERFWNAMLLVDVPNLGIPKRPRRLRRP
jgi:hypothetical protein